MTHTRESEAIEATGGELSQLPLPSAFEALKEAHDAEDAFFRLKTWSLSQSALCASADQIEHELFRGGMEIQRRLLEENIRARGRGEVGRAIVVSSHNLQADGQEEDGVSDKKRLWRKQEHRCQYESLFGTVPVERIGYSIPGEASVHPLDEALNLPHRRYSYPVQERVALRASRGPFDEVVDEVQRTTAAHVPKRQVIQIVEDSAQDFDAFYRERQQDSQKPSEGSVLSVGLDCKGIPRRKSQEELAEPQPARLEPGEKRTKKKMATVASVHTCEPHYRTAEQIVESLMDDKAHSEDKKESKKRERIDNRRIWASVKKSKDEVVQEVCEEMQRRDPEQKKVAVCVMDGERALHKRAIKYLLKAFPGLILILDIIHVLEYLWDAGNALCDNQREAAHPWVRQRLLAILQGDVSRVVSGIRQSATKKKLRGKKREVVDTACDYMLKNKDRMRYDEYLAKGLPIASGAVEGACGHLVKDRMEMTGALWDVGEQRAEAVLKLRALDKSGDFDEYWPFHLQQEKKRLYKKPWKAAA